MPQLQVDFFLWILGQPSISSELEETTLRYENTAAVYGHNEKHEGRPTNLAVAIEIHLVGVRFAIVECKSTFIVAFTRTSNLAFPAPGDEGYLFRRHY